MENTIINLNINCTTQNSAPIILDWSEQANTEYLASL
jgi:hypothetical protein